MNRENNIVVALTNQEPLCGSRGDSIPLPVMRIKMMTDEEWNRLAYRNRLKSHGTADD